VDHARELILDRVHTAWGNGQKASMLLLDIAGAYDNVSHEIRSKKRAAILISSAFKSISTTALDIEPFLTPMKLRLQQTIEETAIRILTGPQMGLLSVGEGGDGKKADRAASWRMDPVGSAGMEEGSDQIGQEMWGKLGDKNCIRAGSMGAHCLWDPRRQHWLTMRCMRGPWRMPAARPIAMAMPKVSPLWCTRTLTAADFRTHWCGCLNFQDGRSEADHGWRSDHYLRQPIRY
jgi:hypothetical protein